jgi:Xaa-Pro aminopeptidase
VRHKARSGTEVPMSWEHPGDTLHELRLFKSDAELTRMRRAAELTVDAHKAVMAAAAAGKNEAELDALIDYRFRSQGANGSAYTNIVAGGENACILHYVENDQPLVDGELCLVDAGAEYEYYAGDVTRTFPINGTFTPDQRALYEVCLRAQEAAIESVRPGASLHSIHEVARNELCRGLIELGVLEGPLERVLEEASYRSLFMHKTSHWLGLDVHDAGAAFVGGEPRPLEAGMVLTVEPGIYIASDLEHIDARWHGIGIRIEDDVLVTESGHEVLTAGAPKSVDEVEAACAGESLAPVG